MEALIRSAGLEPTQGRFEIVGVSAVEGDQLTHKTWVRAIPMS